MSNLFTNPIAAGQLLFTPGMLWDAATKDAAAQGEAAAAYAARVEAAVATFFDSPEVDGVPKLLTHEATLATLRRLGCGSGKGTLQLLTGPRSVGKTLMLRKLAVELSKDKQHPRRLVLFDARQYGADVMRGMTAYLVADASLLQDAVEVAPLSVAMALTRAAEAAAPRITNLIEIYAKATAKGISKLARDHTSPEVRLDELLGTFFKACKKRKEAPVIVIDEANHALSTKDAAADQRALNLLKLLTRVTKQQREATVLLATSEPDFLCRLQRTGYNTSHIDAVIVAGEAPLALMHNLLVHSWGCGQHLATALLSLYGGHVLHAATAVHELATAADPAAVAGTAAVTMAVSGPGRCLSDGGLNAAGVPREQHGVMRKRVREAMIALVVDGYLPLESDVDKAAEVLSLAGVGWVVPHGANTTSVPPRAWATRTSSGRTPTAVLLPSSHTMRLLMADQVFPPASSEGDVM